MSKKKITASVRKELLRIMADHWDNTAFELRKAEQEIFDVYYSDPQLYLDRLRQHIRSQGTEWVFGVEQQNELPPDQGESDHVAPIPGQKFLRCVGRKGCGSSNTTWTGRQTRSADEGMTIFATCKDCGRRWRVQS